MGSRDDDGSGSCREPGDSVVAEAVSQEDHVVAAVRYGIDGRLEPLLHEGAADIVEAFREEFTIDLVGRAGDRVAHLTVQDIAAEEFQSH